MPETTTAAPCSCHDQDSASDALIKKIGVYYTIAAVLAVVMICYFLNRINKA